MKEIHIPLVVSSQSIGDNMRHLDSKAGTAVHFGPLGECEVIQFPKGCRSLQLQHRMRGDYYAEIDAKPDFVAGFGATAPDAMRAAIAKLS